jgi:hypothetical protein
MRVGVEGSTGAGLYMVAALSGIQLPAVVCLSVAQRAGRGTDGRGRVDGETIGMITGPPCWSRVQWVRQCNGTRGVVEGRVE